MDHLRAYESVDHVLSVLSEMHQQIAQVMNELSGLAHEDRGKLALDYLADHESARATALAAYQGDADATLLKQWFQIPFPENLLDLIASLRSRISNEASIDGLVSEIDEFMDRLLPHLRDRSATSTVNALFQDLFDIEIRERLLRSRALASLAQL
jgi:hypothetical protein